MRTRTGLRGALVYALFRSESTRKLREKIETPNRCLQLLPKKMETVISTPKSKREVVVALSKKAKEGVMRKIETSKVKGVAYIECVKDGDNKDKVGVWPPPSEPPFTSWSGLMLCEADSPHAQRLIQKCGGVLITQDGVEAEEDATTAAMAFWKAQNVLGDATASLEAERFAEKVDEKLAMAVSTAQEAWHKAHAELKKSGAVAIGFWTAPEDWIQMLAGKEDSTPCSTKDYPKPSFLPSWT